MAYLIFHYKENANYACFYPAAEHPRDYLSSGVVTVYDDGKIIAYDRNCLNEIVNEKIICEDISVTNKIDKLLEDNKWKIRFIPKYLGSWGFEGSCENIWLKNRHFRGTNFLFGYKKKNKEEFHQWKKQLKKDKVYEWRKYVRYGRSINRFRDIYDEVRKILIDAGMPENLMTE